MISTTEIRFRNGDDVYDLWVEKWMHTDDGDFAVGWCPQLEKNIVVHPDNVIELDAS